MELTKSELGFARAAVRRKRVFAVLSAAGVVVGLALASFTAYRKLRDPGFAAALRGVLALMILLNARQHLRQFRYARILEKLIAPTAGSER